MGPFGPKWAHLGPNRLGWAHMGSHFENGPKWADIFGPKKIVGPYGHILWESTPKNGPI